jgi:carbonic anhydrase/acetyltransferase-like protein (isoleucine patch superfamily)
MKQSDRRIQSYADHTPVVGEQVFIADTARIIGDVTIGAESSIWYGAVVRGDVHHIRIGRRVNVQDHTVIHVTSGLYPTVIDDDVTIGHRVVLHGCTVRRGALVGMGAIVMDEAEVGEEALVGAGSLVTPGTVIPPRTLVVGSPARVKRPLTEQELVMLRASADHYVRLGAVYMEGLSTDDSGAHP